VTPGQFISPAHYGAWMRGTPMRAGRTRWNVPKRWRELVLRKAQWRCEECQTTTDVQVEHIVPVAFGGSNEPCNLTALCGPHNRARWSPEFRQLLEQAEAA
jgi:5-methylcytosine-specific restriction endonuclease McrA